MFGIIRLGHAVQDTLQPSKSGPSANLPDSIMVTWASELVGLRQPEPVAPPTPAEAA